MKTFSMSSAAAGLGAGGWGLGLGNWDKGDVNGFQVVGDEGYATLIVQRYVKCAARLSSCTASILPPAPRQEGGGEFGAAPGEWRRGADGAIRAVSWSVTSGRISTRRRVRR